MHSRLYVKAPEGHKSDKPGIVFRGESACYHVPYDVHTYYAVECAGAAVYECCEKPVLE